MVRTTEKDGREIRGCLGPLVNFSSWNDAFPHLRTLPLPGAQTRNVLREVGLADEEINLLASEGVVVCQESTVNQ